MRRRSKPEKASNRTRQPSAGEFVPKGYGALKGEYVVRRGIDLTKPIYEQSLKPKRPKVARAAE